MGRVHISSFCVWAGSAAALLLLASNAEAADGDFVWAKQLGGTNADYGRDVAVDSAGNVYVVGDFFESLDCDPGPGSFILDSAGGGRDIFVVKLDSTGDLVWAKRMGGESTDHGYNIAVDESGNVYTTGNFKTTADFDPGPGVYNLGAGNHTCDVFVSKLDADGNFVFAKDLGGAGDDTGSDIAVDASGNVYTTGNFLGTADFDPNSGTFYLTSPGDDNNDVFVSKLDSTGAFVWAKAMGGTSDDYGHDIAVDSMGNVCCTGRFQGTADFDPGAGVFELSTTATFAVFVSKLDTAGDFVWAKAMGETGENRGSGIALDDSNNVYTTGWFQGTTDFDPGPGISNLAATGEYACFIQKLNGTGDFIWAKGMTGTSSIYGYAVALDEASNVYTTGHFGGAIDFDPGPGFFNLSGKGLTDVFMHKLDTNGDFVWAKTVGDWGYEYGYGVAVDAFANVYTTGNFNIAADFDPGPGTFDLTPVENFDIFVLKLAGPPGLAMPPEMVPVAAGTFEMGDSFGEGDANELPVHYVTLSAYEIGKYEITNAQYAAVLNWALAQGYLFESDGTTSYSSGGDVYVNGGDNQIALEVSSSYCLIEYSGGTFVPETRDGYPMADHPVVKVSWYGAAAFCNWLSEQEGLTPCYNLTTWDCIFANDGYHLPTEAQWERAAAWDADANRHYRYGNGSDMISLTDVNYHAGAYYSNPLALTEMPYTSPVGYYADVTSPAGCFDMSGNVWEWCNDRGLRVYTTEPVTNPIGLDSGSYRAFRGGSWYRYENRCRTAYRISNNAYNTSYGDYGFRVARSSPIDCTLPGDANGDGEVTPADAQAAFEYYMGTGGAPVCEDDADVCPDYPNGDGSVTPGDAQGIFNTYLEMPSPCE